MRDAVRRAVARGGLPGAVYGAEGAEGGVRVCAEPGCPTLTRTTRCPEHARERDRARGTTTERGYGTRHQRIRAALQARMNEGAVFTCWRPDCDNPIDPNNWHLGHDDHDRTRYRGPECVPCNTATRRRRAGGN